MTFAQGMIEITRGHKIRRASWPDIRDHVLFTNGYLSIHHSNGREDALLVTEGDLFSDDWAVIRESVIDRPLEPVPPSVSGVDPR